MTFFSSVVILLPSPDSILFTNTLTFVIQLSPLVSLDVRI
jgi:hypothetical protein